MGLGICGFDFELGDAFPQDPAERSKVNRVGALDLLDFPKHVANRFDPFVRRFGIHQPLSPLGCRAPVTRVLLSGIQAGGASGAPV